MRRYLLLCFGLDMPYLYTHWNYNETPQRGDCFRLHGYLFKITSINYNNPIKAEWIKIDAIPDFPDTMYIKQDLKRCYNHLKDRQHISTELNTILQERISNDSPL